ncbi:hypothetical protein DRJ16_07905, partial [Candidatus Woesearchaeota archaeon]
MKATPETLYREFPLSIGSAFLRLSVEYPRVLTAGESYNVSVVVRALDLGDEEYVKLRYCSVELEGTSVGSSRVLSERISSARDVICENFSLSVVDPSFDEIRPGDEAKFNLVVRVDLLSENEDDIVSRDEFTFTLPVYVYSPPVYLDVKIDAPSRVVEDESFDVRVRVRNLSGFNLTDCGVAIRGPVDVVGPDFVHVGFVGVGEERSVVFNVKPEERGEIIIVADVWVLNQAGYNYSDSSSIIIDVMGEPELEFYVNSSGGVVKLYGWLSPPRPFTTISILERKSESWTTVSSVSVDSSGYFEYIVERLDIGEHVFKAVWPGDEDYSSVESEAVTIVVNRVPS